MRTDMNSAVVVKKSKISGKGAFAARNFAKGEAVLTWQPKALTKDEFTSLPASQKHYIYKVGGTYLLMQPPERYVNHSCDPNTKAQDNKDIATRVIKKGEEITGDYSNDGVVSFKCNCRSTFCRGIVS